MASTTPPHAPEREQRAVVLEATQLVGGRAPPAELLFSSVGLSFWGGVDPLTAEVVDHTHPLVGRTVGGRALAVPNGRGSCTGSQVMLELLLNGVAPAAVLLRQPDAILALGVVVAEELFGRSIPVLCLGADGFDAVAGASHVAVEGSLVFCGDSAVAIDAAVAARATDSAATPRSADELISASPLTLTDEEAAMLDGRAGEAAAVAMRIVARSAAIEGAPRLLAVTQGHIDGCTYIGPGGLRFAQTLVELGARVAVPTTLNSNSVDRRQWRALGVSPDLGEPAQALGDAYLAMGCSDTSFTCAPYLLESAPGFGEQIAWGESNAVVFANSVLGARTQKYADYLDICAAITGRAPESGPHLDGERAATVVLDAGGLARRVLGEPASRRGGGAGGMDARRHYSEHTDAFFPALGYLCGLKSEAQVPVVVGLEEYAITRDHLKAFSAAFGSTAAVAMFHLAGHTPEAPDAATALLARASSSPPSSASDGDGDAVPCVVLHTRDLADAWAALDSGGSGGRGGSDGEGGADDNSGDGGGGGDTAVGAANVQLVAVGNPHLSLEECAALASLCGEGAVADGVAMVATMGRAVHAQAAAEGHVQTLERFGVQFITDTCWCMLTEPVVPVDAAALATNSAKYAHYAPGLVGRRTRFSSLANCVAAARTGRLPPPPSWAAAAGRRRALHTLLRRVVARR